MKYEISDEIKNNLFVFLDRVQFQGLKENAALNEIIMALSKPIQEEQEKDIR
jgi:hypothetical protein